MKRLACSLLVTGLSLSGAAVAQERYAEEYARTFGNQAQAYQAQVYPSPSHLGYQQRGDIPGASYDYARVLRVDPVIRGGYRGQAVGNQNCQYRQADDVYVRDGYYGNDRYGSRSGGYYGNDPYRGRNDGYYRNDRYGSRNDGYFGNDRYRGRNDGYFGNSRNDGYYGGNAGYGYPRQDETARNIATVVGGIAGAVLGSKVGDGSGQYVGTAIGSMVGGMAGRSIYENRQRNRQVTRGTVTVCDPIPVGSHAGGYGSGYYGNEVLQGYDVTYEYAGRVYQTRTDYHPGDRIRVRVDVRPD